MSEIKSICFHCRDVIPQGLNITVSVDGRQHHVCCEGCRAVTNMLNDIGLSDFYDLREHSSDTLTPPMDKDIQSAAQRWDVYDTEVVAKRFVRTLKRKDVNCSQVTLSVPSIYCSACSWLLERGLYRLSGVVDVSIDITAKRISIAWQGQQVKLSELLNTLASLGYEPVLLDADEELTAVKKERHEALKRLAVSGFGMMQVMSFASALYFGEAQGIEAQVESLLQLVSLIVSSVVVVFSGMPFFLNALRDVSHRRLGMDVPISVAIFGAYSASVLSIFWGNGEVNYLDSVVMFIFFLSLARFVEMLVRHRAVAHCLSLTSLLPSTVSVERAGKTMILPREDLRPNDVVRVEKNSIVPVDGACEDQRVWVDESILTGESNPQSKMPLSTLLAGSRNLGQTFRLKVTRLSSDSAFNHIESLVNGAQKKTNHTIYDTIVPYFVSAVLLLAATCFALWWWIDPSQAFANTLSVLVVTCPCALALARPTAMTAATHGLRKVGLLVTDTGLLDQLTKVNAWVFDKTGTLTKGLPRIKGVLLYGAWSQDYALAVAAAMERRSSHPLASAFHDFDTSVTLERLREIPGKGIEARLNQQDIRLGKMSWVNELCGDKDQQKNLDTHGSSHIALANRHGLLAEFLLEDTVRNDAGSTLAVLARDNMSLHLLSGDNSQSVKNIAEKLNLDHIAAELSPAQKLKELNNIRQQHTVCAYVGDGVNDAPVLAHADVSIAMGSGAKLAQTSAGVIILNDRLGSLLLLRRVARKTQQIVRQNLCWSLLYNVCALPLAMLGLLPPWLAALGMSLSSLIVVMNASRLAKKVEYGEQKQGSDNKIIPRFIEAKL